MIRRGGPRFHRHALFWPGAPGQPAKDREGKPAQIVHAFLEHGQYHVTKHVSSHLSIFPQVPANVFPSVFLLHRKVGMPPWVAGMWSTLSARIRWLVLWATLPAVLLVVYQARTHRTDAIAAAEERALQTLQSVAGTQQRLIQNTRQFLQQLAAMPQVHDPAAPQCGRYLAEVLSLNTTYVNIGVPRADGELLCNARPLKAPVNVANRPYFQQTISGRDFAVGSFQVDRAAQVASVNFAYPVIPPGTQDVVAAAVAVVSLEWWSLRLTDLGLPDGAVPACPTPTAACWRATRPMPASWGLRLPMASSAPWCCRPRRGSASAPAQMAPLSWWCSSHSSRRAASPWPP